MSEWPSDGRAAGREPEPPIRVLLASALPPPPGGMATWTQLLCQRGLPAPFEVELVNTRVFRHSQFTPPKPGPKELKRNFYILRQIRRKLGSGQFSLLHLNCGLTLVGVPRNLASARLARRAGIPYIVHLHGTFRVPKGGSPTDRFYRWAYRTIFKDAAWILALGQPSYRAVLELGDFAAKTTPLLPNFVDCAALPEGPADSPLADGLRVLFTGALIEEKGCHTIVEIARRLPHSRFQLVGDGTVKSRANLLRLIAANGLSERVQVQGPLSNGEVLELLGRNDLFLFPSKLKYEGFPVSVAEAMAAGLPVVASPVGALPEMIDVPAGGFLAAPEDVDGYVDALERLTREPALRQKMGQHNRQKARREYDYAVVTQQICEIYAKVAGRG